jgi:hypothetical protein
MTKKILHDFHDIRNASLDTGGRADIQRPRRARGGKIEMRLSGGADVDRDQPCRSRRAAGGRSRKTKPMAMSGEAVKHRADRAPRRKQKLADGGVPGGASAMPYGGAPGYVPVVQLQPAHFSAPAVPPQQPDYTPQLIGLLCKHDDDSKADGQGIIGAIKLPGGGTVGDATQDFFQDLGDWRDGGSGQARLEIGDFDDHTARMAKIADLKVQRGQIDAERRYYEAQPRLPDDPVEAFTGTAQAGDHSAGAGCYAHRPG